MAFICEYSLHCICKQMSLDGIEVMFIHLAFERDVLQCANVSCFCVL